MCSALAHVRFVPKADMGCTFGRIDTSADRDARAIDDRLRIQALRHGAKGATPVAIEARRAKRVGDRRCRVPHQQTSLEGKGHHLHNPTRYRLKLAQLPEPTFDFVRECIQPRIGTTCLSDFV